MNDYPARIDVYFTRAILMFVSHERLEYARIWDGNCWSKPFDSTTEARAHGEKVGWVNRGKFVEKRKLLYWRAV